jgi:hypothetical protein
MRRREHFDEAKPGGSGTSLNEAIRGSVGRRVAALREGFGGVHYLRCRILGAKVRDPRIYAIEKSVPPRGSPSPWYPRPPRKPTIQDSSAHLRLLPYRHRVVCHGNDRPTRIAKDCHFTRKDPSPVSCVWLRFCGARASTLSSRKSTYALAGSAANEKFSRRLESNSRGRPNHPRALQRRSRIRLIRSECLRQPVTLNACRCVGFGGSTEPFHVGERLHE